MDRNSNNDEGKTNMETGKLRQEKHKIESFLRGRIEKATRKRTEIHKIRNTKD